MKHLVIVVFVVLCSGGSAYACMCGHTSVCDAYQQANLVIGAQVIGIKPAKVSRTFIYEDGRREKQEENGQEVILRVSRWFKGQQIDNQIKLMQPNSTCDWSFDESNLKTDYLLYLVKSEEARSYVVVACGRSTELSRAAEDLDWLNNNSGTKGTTWLSGKASLNTHDFPPLKGIDIQIDGPKESYRYTTDKDGRYRLKGAAPGRYHISAQAADNLFLAWTTSVPEDWTYFWSVDKPEPKALDVTLEAGKCAGVSFMFESK